MLVSAYLEWVKVKRSVFTRFECERVKNPVLAWLECSGVKNIRFSMDIM
jgi:hypothetical protein